MKTKSITIMVAAAALAALGETYHVSTSGDDGNDGLGWATAKATIQGGVDAAAAADDVVLVAPGNYALASTVTVPRAITIRGSSGDPADVAVDGGEAVRCFALTAPAALESLTIQNGNMAGTLGNGGGVDMADGFLSNCVFRANRSGNSGGAVNMTTATVQDCLFVSNATFQAGGAVRMTAGRVARCAFAYNKTTHTGGGSQGGALAMTAGTVLDSAFASNQVFGTTGGGGIYQSGTAEGFVSNCVVVGNWSYSGYGAGMHAEFVRIMDSRFVENGTNVYAGVSLGGGLYAKTSARLSDCTFEDNRAGTFGAGAYVSATGTGTVENCTFDGNATTFTGGSLYGGGGLFLGGDGAVSGCAFSNNVITGSAMGGGGFLQTGSGAVLVTNCLFAGNTARAVGAGAYLTTGVAWDCVFRDNVATNTGGGFQVAGAGAIRGCQVVANEARGSEGGGGGYVTGGGSVLDCAFTSNRVIHASNGHAGGLHLSSGTELARCVFRDNVSSKLGGGVRVASGFVYDCAFVGNRAGSDGGGIRMDAVAVTVSNCVFAGNVAASFGGGVYHSNGFLTDCVVVSNISSRSGGQVVGAGVYINTGVFQNSFIGYNAATNGSDAGAVGGGGGVVRNCLVIGNEARYGGAARYGGVFENCTIAGNKATTQGGGIWTNNGKPALTNCVLYANEAPAGANYYGSPIFAHTCTTPVAEIDGNLDADPRFTAAGSGAGLTLVAGDYQLPRGSPCVDKALELPWMATARDLEGNERLFGDEPDMGAYEYIAFKHGTTIVVR